MNTFEGELFSFQSVQYFIIVHKIYYMYENTRKVILTLNGVLAKEKTNLRIYDGTKQ